MRELLPFIDRWHDDGKRVADRDRRHVWGSAPRPIGSKMAISSSGDMEGSVSGGCVESAVFEATGGVLATGRPVLLEFGVSDERAWSVGLSSAARSASIASC